MMFGRTIDGRRRGRHTLHHYHAALRQYFAIARSSRFRRRADDARRQLGGIPEST